MSKLFFYRKLLAAAITSILAFPASAGLRYVAEKTQDGTPYIVVVGDFTLDDNFDEFREIVRSHQPTGIGFDSPGGNVTKAMEFGRIVRGLGLTTIQPRAIECASACSLAFLGGVVRIAEPGSIGVHKSSFSGIDTVDAQIAVSAVQQLTANVITYMVEMGVDPALLQLSLQYESNDIRYLSGSEMEQYRVTTSGEASPQGAPSAPVPPPSTVPAPDIARRLPDLTIPVAQTGRVRHPKGKAPIKADASGKSATVMNLENGFRVAILSNAERWYRVRAAGKMGYMHHTWVYVDQYESGPFDQRHIQIASFDNFEEAQSYVRSGAIPLAAQLATNGWFAITLQDTYRERTAADLVKLLKEKGTIPDDAFMTYGNTYVREVCCRD